MVELHNPLEQFEIRTVSPMPELAGFNIDFTNSAAFMFAAVVLTFLFLFVGMRKKALVPGRMQMLAEMTYEFVASTVRENVGLEGKTYFPFIFSLFMFILFCNLLGMLPFSFTVTSHIIVTFALALLILIGVTIIGFAKHGAEYLRMFMPHGVPLYLAPLVIPIEILSYLSRPVSLSMRLTINMLAGHTLLKVIAGFVSGIGIAGILPLAVLVGLNGFELFVAFLQAYVFTVLTCVYLNDALHLH